MVALIVLFKSWRAVVTSLDADNSMANNAAVVDDASKSSSILAGKQLISNDTSKQTSQSSKDISLVECLVVTFPADGGTTKNDVANGIIEITVRHDLSPIASKVFLDLVHAHHFDQVFLFRVLKGFVAQFGVRTTGNANIDKELVLVTDYTKPPKTKDELHATTLSNVRGTLSFAGGNPATEQVFVNLGNNERLDKENSRPFATVSDNSMQQVLDQLYTGYKDGNGQIKTLQQGEAAMREKFPRMSRVEQCRVVPAFASGL